MLKHFYWLLPAILFAGEKQRFMKPCNKNIQKTLDLTGKMIDLANQGVDEREDDACAILYGVLLDSAYKIKKMAEKEKEAHIQKGWW